MSRHLKRSYASRAIRIHRKEHKWTIRPRPGPHPLRRSIALGIVVRDYLKLADTKKEAKRIISEGEILVDGVKRKDYKFPCGFMDVISVPRIKKHFRVLFDRKGMFQLLPILEKDSGWKLSRVEGKKTLRGKKIQLNLHDGKNKLVEKDEYKTGDVLKISFKNNEILDVYKFDKGSVSMVIGGRHIGELAEIEDIEIIKSSNPNIVSLKGKKEFSTVKEHVFPVGKDKPVIELPEVKI